jgi:hypothetical protein
MVAWATYGKDSVGVDNEFGVWVNKFLGDGF